MIFSRWLLDPAKCLLKKEVEKLLGYLKTKAQETQSKPAIRNYFTIHLALATGLRVMEIAKLNCDDLFIENVVPLLIVKKGKGGKRRIVFFNSNFKKHCKEYLEWKESIGESINPGQPLIVSSNTGKHLTTRALQLAFKHCAKEAGLPSRYSIHCLRHTYACFLLKASKWNIRLVQKQLGHSRLETTQVYADVMMPDIKNSLEKLDF
jgi:site-specific recombinase XerD